jgi:hypothetical protein
VQNIVLPSHRCPAVDADAGRHTCVTTTRTGFSEVLILKRLKAAGPVSRILSAELLPQDGHSSGLHITVQLKRPTRRFGAPSRHAPPAKLALRRSSLPIWSCSVWGLPCPLHYCRGGALLPHLFTLTRALPPRRYVFCGTSRQPTLKSASRTLSGTLLCGVRTFLPRFLTRRERPSGPAAYAVIISDEDHWLRIEFETGEDARTFTNLWLEARGRPCDRIRVRFDCV